MKNIYLPVALRRIQKYAFLSSGLGRHVVQHLQTAFAALPVGLCGTPVVIRDVGSGRENTPRIMALVAHSQWSLASAILTTLAWPHRTYGGEGDNSMPD